MTREMQRLDKATASAQTRLSLLSGALKEVHRQQQGLVGLSGAVRPAQVKQLESQRIDLSRQIAQIQTRISNLHLMRGAAGGGGTTGGGGGAEAIGDMTTGLAKSGAGGALTGIGGIVGGPAGAAVGAAIGSIVAAAAGAAVGIITTVINEETSRADFSSRMLGLQGGLGKEKHWNDRVRWIGSPLGYSSMESRQIFGAMGKGGGFLGAGLEADARTAMQMGRFFGLDAGAQANLLAGAQRTGAFRAGDAKKFAEILASQIARTGLGPRAEEVQEATLDLLHLQLQNQPSASATGGLVQLQALFNKTGIPAFQGAYGAQLIGNMQQRFTSTGGPRDEALKQMILAKMGYRNFFGMEEAKERGFNDPRLLPTMFNTLLANTHNEAASRFIMKEEFGIPMLKSKALMKHFPHGIKPSDMIAANAMLQGGAGAVEKGANAAMKLPGNQVRRLEADIYNKLIDVGQNTVRKLIDISSNLNDLIEGQKGIKDYTKTIVDSITRIADKIAPQSLEKTVVDWTAKKVETFGKKALAYLSNPDQAAGDVSSHGAKWHKGWGVDLKWKDETAAAAAMLGLKVSSAQRTGKHAITVTGNKSYHLTGRALDFAGPKEKMEDYYRYIQKEYKGQIRELFYTPIGCVKDNVFHRPGTFNAAVERTHYNHVHVALDDTAKPRTLIVRFEGTQLDAESRLRLQKEVQRVVEEKHIEHSRVHTNRRNKR